MAGHGEQGVELLVLLLKNPWLHKEHAPLRHSLPAPQTVLDGGLVVVDPVDKMHALAVLAPTEGVVLFQGHCVHFATCPVTFLKKPCKHGTQLPIQISWPVSHVSHLVVPLGTAYPAAQGPHALALVAANTFVLCVRFGHGVQNPALLLKGLYVPKPHGSHQDPLR